jgi:Ni/Fe-hydrogenase subunit HybB-like protein
MRTTTPTQRRDNAWTFFLSELKPKGTWLTIFNAISVVLFATSAVILFIRFTQGLGSVTNLDQDFAWGIWKGLNVVTGVAFAGGAYVVCFLVYILRLEQYRPIVRITVLNGFLSYCFYALALLLELGRPWHIMNPMIGNSFGLTSVLFLIAWHFTLYIFAQFIEFSPAIAEWLGLKRLHRILSAMTIGAVVFGITLSTLHQSALGALFLTAESKIHPLWYSELIPLQFFISSMFAGVSMVIIEGTISRRVFVDRMGPVLKEQADQIVIGLARIAGGAVVVYLGIQVMTFTHAQNWRHLSGPWGAWWLFEMIGMVAVPGLLLLFGSETRRTGVIRTGAALALVGIVVNRLNVSIIAYKWDAPIHYVPTWMECVVAITVLVAQVWALRWIVTRMPVLGYEPIWAADHEHSEHAAAELA